MTKEQLISSIKTNTANLEYLKVTGTINGSLYLEIVRIMESYARDCAKASLIKAAENANVKDWSMTIDSSIIDKSSITDEDNIVLL